jgi:hypothetical protein
MSLPLPYLIFELCSATALGKKKALGKLRIAKNPKKQQNIFKL